MSAIEWTDKTVNVQIGCSRKSPGCERCYAETQANALARRFGKRGQAGHRYLSVVDGKGRWSRDVVLDAAVLDRPPHGAAPHGHGIPKRKRKSNSEGDGWRAPRVFIGSMTDHFHELVTGEMLEEVIEWMALAPSVTWQMVTKRPERAHELLKYVRQGFGGGQQWPRIHLLATVEDQQRANERIDHLLAAAPFVELIGLSVEPLLGSVVIPHISRLGWVIVGGESGRGARACDVAWVRHVVEQCDVASVPVFVKQLGAQPAGLLGCIPADDGASPRDIPGATLRDPKGGDWAEWPEDLRRRAWP